MKAKIAVIDDEESICLSFESFLCDQGYEVVTAEDYNSALELLPEQNDIDLAYVDIILGERSGIDILRYIKENKMPCHVIIITGQPDIETAADSVRLGAFDYLVKPIRKDSLLRVTRFALEHVALTAEKERYRNNLEAIFRSITEAIITVDLRMQILEANSSVKNVFGKDPDEITGRIFKKALGHSYDECRKLFSETLETNTAVKEQRIECRHPDRPYQILSVNSSPLLDQHRKTMGAVLVAKDITRILDMESELRERSESGEIVTQSKKMLEALKPVKALADTDTTVLITGESGTGKELVARALHYKGHRSHGPLIAVNCHALSENLLESELFGHVKGAFTGAATTKPGCFKASEGGTIFLDEIGEISPNLQTKLLRVLQEKEFYPVGSSLPVKVDVRVIAATNKNLKEELKQGNFREDLYYRIKVMEISLPPLRDRLEDIPLLVDHLCNYYNRIFKKHITGIEHDVLEVFMKHHWPGNVRELKHAIEHSFILCNSNKITLEHIPSEIGENENTPAKTVRETPADEPDRILRVLRQTDWNKSKTARILGISRVTLYEKINKYNITNSGA